MSTDHLDLVRKLIGQRANRKRAVEDGVKAILAEQAFKHALKSGGTLRRLQRLAEAELRLRAEFALDVVRRVSALKPTPIQSFMQPTKELVQAVIEADYREIWDAVSSPAPVQQNPIRAIQAVEWHLSTVRIEQIERILAEIDFLTAESMAEEQHQSAPRRVMRTVQKYRLSVIVAIDMVGYSTRAEKDEARAVSDVVRLRQLVEQLAQPHGGRIFGSAGDGFMLEFHSCAHAIEAAEEIAMQCEPRVRVGVHAGDVDVRPDGDLLGHNVNVAERVRALANPGTVLVSADAKRMTRSPIAAKLVSRGVQRLNKMDVAIELFEVVEKHHS